MASEENVILLTWPTTASAYEAQSQLTELGNSGAVEVRESAVVERGADGTLTVPQGDSGTVGLATLGGSTLGVLVGVLGGPVGALLGWASGALIGGAWDLSRADDSDSVIAALSSSIPPGSNALIADVVEGSHDAVDGLAARSGARLVRKPTDEVLDEVDAAEEAADEAAAAARKKVREEKKADRSADRHARVNKLKDKLNISSGS
ncbi:MULTISPECIES: DUF1269 domain-containing protein [Tsukamurella]|uniref:DUF1269 domain-containing protein n=1 Tax=Tsukamurella strandjordii TaxID=147577 RepID=A0AA90SFY9_9ACTN|nr:MULTISPECIES: DUF1269 domain-containing protein [Tsukamurella]MDP0397119.1 DUF1269 domain-containing protein [Tsukamurella strandjordii]GIZ96923.1 hypothetical protein TTY48_15350 [Tsukamurella sp. TY48]